MTNLREAVAAVVDRVLRSTFNGCPRPPGHKGCNQGNCPCDALHNDIADATLAAIEAAGFAVVPKEATEAMVEAGMAARKMAGRVSGAIGQTTDSSWRHEFRHEIYTWAAMLDAAPKP